MFKHILLPTDGSPLAMKAVKAGIEIAKDYGARVTGYYAVEKIQQRIYGEGYMMGRRTIADVDKRMAKYGEKQLQAIAKLAKQAGVPYTALCSRADAPYEGIVDAAKRRKCDLIVMASHARKGVARVVMGSVTQKVLQHADVPVLVYR